MACGVMAGLVPRNVRIHMCLLYFIDQARQLNLSEYDLFQRAYEHTFGCEGDVANDYVQYLLHGILPNYIITWCQHLQN
jgi:hypothetical protein